MFKARIFIALFLVVGVISACKKELSPEKQAEKDDKIISEFISKNSILATKHSSGVYYQIISEGSGARPTLSNEVVVTYKGALLNGNVFDESKSAVTFPLNGLIVGWQIGIPLVKKGGSIRLIVPSGLAYGNSSPGAGIPENAVLDFTIDLIDVK